MPHPITESTALLFDKYGALVFRRCKQLLRDDEAARDAVQEVFLRVITRKDTFREKCTIATWLYKIATTYCLQQLRNIKRRREKLVHLSLSQSLQVTFEAETQITIIQMFLNLGQEAQCLAFFRFIDGMTLDEVAEVSGLSRKTVGKKLQKINRKLTCCFAEKIEKEV